MTVPERLLWARFRGRQLGTRALRQAPVGRYIVDFLFPEIDLVIEVDGLSHADRLEHDLHRQRTLEKQGLLVVRLTNDAVIADADTAAQCVHEIVQQRLAAMGLTVETPATEEHELDEQTPARQMVVARLAPEGPHRHS